MIILDRDGVINFESPEYIKCPEEWHALPGSLEAIARLNQAGHKVVIMTNQSGVGRGYYDEAMLAKIHQKLQDELAAHGGHVEKIYYCPHHPDHGCDCRKPEPGMLRQIQKDYDLDLTQCLVIGDSWRDIQAGRAMGCKAWLVKTGFGAEFLKGDELPDDVPAFDNLAAAVDHFLKLSVEN
jgi:D-glycero-D-manno-heptose 1,7-bisphosphate phosphatase